MTKPLKGGLLLNNEALQLGLSGFSPVLRMLLSYSAEIKVLTANSLSGFMFTLNVVPGDSTYTNFKKNNTTNITTFIIKIVVIKEQKQPLPKFKGIPKLSETESSFLTEAQLQQTIWIRNIIGGKPEFTPSVANFALFEQSQSLNVLKCLVAKAKGDVEIMDVIHYLSRINSLKLGVLLMPMINNSVSLYKYVSNSQHSDEQKKTAYCHTIANIVKLFILINVVHWDLHPENVMIVDNDDDDEKNSFLIDFGRASNIKKPTDSDHIPDSYLDAETKSELYGYAEKCKQSFFDITGPVKRERKRNYTNLQEEQQKQKSIFMENICRTLTGLDRFINGERIQGDYKDKGYYQMNWMEQIYSSPDKDEIFLCAYEKLKSDYLTDKVEITIDTIKLYIRRGRLIDLAGNPDSYYYVFPTDVVLPELQVPNVAALRIAPPPQRHVFNSSIFLEQHATPHSPAATPHVIISHALLTLEESLKTATHEDDRSSKTIRIGGKTKKKKNKKRKTRKIKSRRTKRTKK
jgi:hypothetical protein